MDLAIFNEMVDQLREMGFADPDIEWSENIVPPADAEHFARETIFVICNSGMKNTVARKIYNKIRDELLQGGSAHSVFGHVGKATAIDRIWGERDKLFEEFENAQDKLAFCASLPWIGGITKFHLMKNFGMDCAKPDVHLQRLAEAFKTTPSELCAGLAKLTGYRIATIDLLLWRASAEGVIDSHTGELARRRQFSHRARKDDGMATDEGSPEKEMAEYDAIMQQIRADEAARAGISVEELEKRRRQESVDKFNAIYGNGAAVLTEDGKFNILIEIEGFE